MFTRKFLIIAYAWVFIFEKNGALYGLIRDFSGPPLERPPLPPEKSGLSKGVASQEGDISMHF
jgi:hypothetical protein